MYLQATGKHRPKVSSTETRMIFVGLRVKPTNRFTGWLLALNASHIYSDLAITTTAARKSHVPSYPFSSASTVICRRATMIAYHGGLLGASVRGSSICTSSHVVFVSAIATQQNLRTAAHRTLQQRRLYAHGASLQSAHQRRKVYITATNPKGKLIAGAFALLSREHRPPIKLLVRTNRAALRFAETNGEMELTIEGKPYRVKGFEMEVVNTSPLFDSLTVPERFPPYKVVQLNAVEYGLGGIEGEIENDEEKTVPPKVAERTLLEGFSKPFVSVPSMQVFQMTDLIAIRAKLGFQEIDYNAQKSPGVAKRLPPQGKIADSFASSLQPAEEPREDTVAPEQVLPSLSTPAQVSPSPGPEIEVVSLPMHKKIHSEKIYNLICTLSPNDAIAEIEKLKDRLGKDSTIAIEGGAVMLIEEINKRIFPKYVRVN